ncbi:MAG: DUF1648 domain-containing protein [Thermomicrobiales bacterium]
MPLPVPCMLRAKPWKAGAHYESHDLNNHPAGTQPGDAGSHHRDDGAGAPVHAPDVFFAVTVSPAFPASAEGGQIRRQYQRRVVLAGCVAIALVLSLFPFLSPAAKAILGAAAMLGLLGVLFWAFFSGRRQVLPHAAAQTTVREAGLSPRHGLPIGSAALFAGPFLVIAAASLFLALRYESLPQQIPMHYNAAGEIDRYAQKSISSVFALPITATAVCLLMATITWSMARGVKRARGFQARPLSTRRACLR